MRTRRVATSVSIAAGGLALLLGAFRLGELRADTRRSYLIEHDSEVAAVQPGPHRGTGETVAYSFFAKAEGFHLAFRKRALRPGASIGYHQQREDEVYYVLSGRGVMTLDGKEYEVGPGTAILTRPGSSHGLKQAGTEDLVIMIAYETRPRTAPAPAAAH
jgi:quercetin dioxygenase-like cupin family protein